MRQSIMPMWVGVRLCREIILPVRMPVVLIVDVGMGMLDEVVLMPVLVALAQVKPEAKRHEERGRQEQGGQRLTIKYKAQTGTDEGRQREVRSRSSGAQSAQGKDKADQAHTIPEKSGHQGSRCQGG